jgi:hypothetical protein
MLFMPSRLPHAHLIVTRQPALQASPRAETDIEQIKNQILYSQEKNLRNELLGRGLLAHEVRPPAPQPLRASILKPRRHGGAFFYAEHPSGIAVESAALSNVVVR